jgi:flagellar motor switch protein FliN/FliY
MALTSEIPMGALAAAAARAIEDLLGHGVALTIGTPVSGDPAYRTRPEGATRAVMLPFRDGIAGDVTLVVDEHLAAALEAVAPDEMLTTAALPALLAVADEIARTAEIDVDPEDAGEIAADNLVTVVGDCAGVQLYELDTPVACLVVRIVDEAAALAAFGAADAFDPAAAVTALTEVAAASDERTRNDVVHDDVEPSTSTGSADADVRPIALLNDVAMEVTAQLGRRRLKVRDIVTLQPGSVLQLDRAAGSPVDVLVNGALVWRGEVVVVDDDLTVRVSDVVVDEAASAPRPR